MRLEPIYRPAMCWFAVSLFTAISISAQPRTPTPGSAAPGSRGPALESRRTPAGGSPIAKPMKRDEVTLPPLIQEEVIDAPAQSLNLLEIPAQWQYRPPPPPPEGTPPVLAPEATTLPAQVPSFVPTEKTAPPPIPPATSEAAIPAGFHPIIANLGQRVANPSLRFSTPVPRYMMQYAFAEGGLGDANTTFMPVDIRVFETSTGRQVAATTLSPGFLPRALSDDGKRVLAEWFWKQHRVDVFEFKPARHLVGWRPHPDVDRPGSSNELKVNLRVAAFTDPDHVVTATAEDGITRWHLPDCKAVYKYAPAPSILGSSPCLTAEGQCLIMADGSLFDLKEGKFRGLLPNMPNMVHISLSPDGRKLAAMQFFKSADMKLKIYDLTTGSMVRSIACQPPEGPPSSTGLTWCSDNYLVAADKLIDQRTGQYVWRAKSVPVRNVAGYNWFFVRNASQSRLMGIEFPGKALTELLEKGGIAMPGAIVHPDMDVTLSYVCENQPPDAEALKKNIIENMARSLATSNIRVVKQAPVTLRLTIYDGEEVTYVSLFRLLGPGVSARTVMYRGEWIGPQGEVLWKMDMNTDMTTIDMPGDATPQKLRAAFWDRLMKHPEIWVPRAVYPPSKDSVPAAGEATVDFDGQVNFKAAG